MNRLINLSSNNKALLLRRLTSTHFIDLHEFDYALNEPSFEIIRDLVGHRSVIPLCPVADSRREDNNRLSLQLKKILRVENQLQEEHGSRDLCVGWPFVQGKFADGTHVRAPLLFFPVELEQRKGNWVLTQGPGTNVTLNKSFLLAYAHYNQIKISDDTLERTFDDFDTDITVFRTGLYQFLKETELELHFNQDNFSDRLEPFPIYQKDEFEKGEKKGVMKLYPNAVLGIFPQSGSHLVQDYELLLEGQFFSDLEEFFETKTLDPNPDDRYGFLNKIREDQTFTPFKQDAFQENALKAVKQGNSIVVQGPPGTGKSQLICNIISDYIARDKTVLVVCQKRAALDVVFQRFDEIGMADFIGLVHDYRADRKELYSKIARQINHIEEYRLNNNSLDSVHLERQFNLAARRIDQLSEELEEFKAALYDESECGLSVKELYLTSSISDPAVNVKQEYKFFTFDKLAEILGRMRYYAQYAARFRSEEYALLDRKTFAKNTITTLRTMQEILQEIPKYEAEIGALTKEIIGHNIHIEECLIILDKREDIKELLRLLSSETTYQYFQHMVTVKTEEKDLQWLSNHERLMMDCFAGEGIESHVPDEEMGYFQECLQGALAAKRNIFKWIQWLAFSKQRKIVDEILKKNNLPRSRKGLKLLAQKIDNRLNLEHNITLAEEKPWIPEYSGGLNKGRLQEWFYTLKESFRAKLIFVSLRNFKEYFNTQKLTYKELEREFEELFRNIQHIPDLWVRWNLYFTKTQLHRMAYEPGWIEVVENTLQHDFDSLCDFDSLSEEMPIHEVEVANRTIQEMGNFDVDKFEDILNNSLRLQWIEHIETKYPALRIVSSMKFRQMEAELQKNVQEKLRISNEILLLKAKERTYEHVEYNRLKNMVTYRELGHQVTKQRRVWPIRKTISEFHDELFNLIPCWLASPETVSAIFPMDKIFDLVVFDEASQCFTERGVPAMYRGKQVVVTGDEKQLRPNDLYQTRWSDDEEEDVSLEVDSLLELSSQYLMNVKLNEHYRSKKLELIGFSNEHFYDNQLKVLPDRNLVNDEKPAIEYIKVDGIWENNTNRVEAEKVAELVFEISKSFPDKEIGVVTFNAKQQDMVLDVLEEFAVQNNRLLPKGLLVKNIENVQGDEKDIIIFSTAYAPDQKGKLVMQFGSLNQAHGENRLNVAVTRAREKIILVSSIHPEQLKVDDSKNDGPKLLKEYLKYASLVSDGKYIPEPKVRLHKDRSWYLKDRLMEWGNAEFEDCELREELPFADITIVKGGKYAGLLITDDDLYFQSPSIKDTHVYTPFTLSGKQWKFRGIFSREYWQNSNNVTEELTRFISQTTVE